MARRGGKMVWLLGQGQLRVLGSDLLKLTVTVHFFWSELHFIISNRELK